MKLYLIWVLFKSQSEVYRLNPDPKNVNAVTPSLIPRDQCCTQSCLISS